MAVARSHNASVRFYKLVLNIDLPHSSEEKQSLERSLDLYQDFPSYPTKSQTSFENSQYSRDSDKSPTVSMFDFGIQSDSTRPSTVPTSVPSAQRHISGALQVTGLSTSDNLDESDHQSISKKQHTEEHEESENATIYSIETLTDDPQLHYFRVFVTQLAEDVRTGAEGMVLMDLGPDYLEHALKEFAWKLHEESSNPFQLETSVIIHRKRR